MRRFIRSVVKINYASNSKSEIMARLSANLRINEFFKRRILWRKKARYLLKRCPEKQSNMVKALTGSYSLKRRKAIEKPKFPDPSNCFFFFMVFKVAKNNIFSETHRSLRRIEIICNTALKKFGYASVYSA